MKRILLMCVTVVFIAGFTNSAWAQDRTVSGRVTSQEDGSSLPGVSIILKGTVIGTQSDANGNYSLSVPASGGTLVFSFIGLVAQEIAIDQKSTIDVVMSTDVSQLAEIVVVGYGVQDKRTLTSSISSVKGSDISLLPVQSFDQALAGKAAGVQVLVSNGLVGNAPAVRIRGVSSLSSGTTPLYVVDGVPSASGNQSGVASGNALGDINPIDIESIEVLKDGAASAIYGSRAANGVVLITTKRGKSGKPSVNFDYQFGVNTIAKRYEVLNAEEFIAISNEKFATVNTAPQAFPGSNNEDTDWQDVIFRNGHTHNYNINFSGGSKELSYYFSAGYMKQEGAVERNQLERYSMMAKIDYTGVDWLSTGVKLQVSRQVNNGLNTGASALSGNVSSALKAFPNVPVYDDTDPTGYNLSPDGNALGSGNNLLNIASNYTNVQYTVDKNIYRADNYRVLPTGYLQVNILEGLSVRTQLGADLVDNDDFQSLDPFHGDGGGATAGYVYRAAARYFTWNWHNTITYKKTLAEKHNLALVIGNEYQKSIDDSFYGDGQNFSDPSFVKNGLISSTYTIAGSGGNYQHSGFDSYFGRVNYDFSGKYLLGFTLRQDAISDLSEANRTGLFPGASIGWVVTEEDFFNVPQVSQLKVRGSYAEVGNTSIGSFPYVGSYSAALYGSQSGISFSQIGNSSLTWETSKKLDIGIDFGLWNNRITATIDYFKNNIDGMILSVPLPPTAGVPGNTIRANVGVMENSGIEITIGSENIRKGDFSWTTDLTFSTNKNKIISLTDDGSDLISLPYITRVGESMNSIYVYEYAGVNAANGNPLYKRGDGSIIQGDPDNQSYYLYDPANPTDLELTTSLNDDDLKIVGQFNPKYFGGLNNTVRWKGFDFSLMLTYAGGHKVFNASRQTGLQMEFVNNSKEILNRWTPENTDTDVPRLKYAASSFLNINSTRFVEKADYLRCQNISLGYTVPKNVLDAFSKGTISTIRVYAQVRNAFVITDYSGTDPETGGGYDNNTNPLLRTYNFGITIGL